MNRRLLVVALLASLLPVGAPAAPLKPEEIPPALREWQRWVLHDEVALGCPFLDGGVTRVCVWPGRLQLNLDERGGTFSQTVHAYREEWVALPGDQRRWPQSVKLDGKEVVVAPHGDHPSVHVPVGDHTLSGQFLWDALPEALDVPPETALLTLAVRGQSVAMPNRDNEGRVFLQKESKSEEAENMELTVSRRLTDEIPFTLTTRVELQVSGKSREVLLGRALPEGFVPMSINAGVPARIEPDGRLRLQVKPGAWTVDLVARRDSPVTELKRPQPDGPWSTGDEVWVFEARPSLRQVLVEGVDAVDPTQTRLPSEWKHLPAYAVGSDATVRLTERRRGDADPPPDLLTLQRQWWLDFDGKGMTVSDKISGQLHRGWRLDMLPGTELGRVVASGADQSITRLGPGKPSGVELREGRLSLEADSRISTPMNNIPAVSWDADFHQVSGSLQLPPGWRLFHASGADDVKETWVHTWTLLAIFLVMITAVAIGRLFGVAWGGLAVVALTLSFNEEDAPQYVWLAVLVGEALVRVLPEHWVRTAVKLYRFGAWAALVVITVSFMVQHVRLGLYPALEQGRRLGGVQTFSEYSTDNAAQYARSSSVNAPGSEVWANDEDGSRGGAAGKKGMLKALSGSLGSSNEPAEAPAPPTQQGYDQRAKQRSFNVLDYDKNAMVQTGPGVPRWQWTTVTLGFSGPVQRAQTLRLWLVPPAVNRALAFVRVILLGLLVLCLLGFPGTFWPTFLRRKHGVAVAAGLAVALFPALDQARAAGKSVSKPGLVANNNAAGNAAANLAAEDAPLPDPDLLAQLKSRLLEQPECAPLCVSSPRLELEASARELRIRVEVLAAADTALPLPGNAAHWVPDQVLLDGKATNALLRTAEGTLWVAVGEGIHQLLVSGALPARETVQLALPLKPHRVEAKLEGWTLDGLHEDGLADDNLQLSRQQAKTETSGVAALQAGTLPPFVRVERTLKLGLEWTVETRVVRLTPTGSAIVLEVPLLPGESVTTSDVRVQSGKALVNMGPQAGDASWTSVLQQKSPLTLKAPEGLPWVEVWRLDVSPIWHVQLSGIPVVHQQDASGVRLPEWRPWPGESVSIDVVKPDSVPGQTLTIDQSALHLSPGVRATDATLTFNLRSSRGGLHTLTLPADAQLQNVTINGQQQPIRQDGAHLALPLIPGSQSVELSWRQTSGIEGFYRTPVVDLGTPSVNADLELDVPADRWMLFVGGPRMGPAVLFWSFFFVLLGVSIGLARIHATPLRTHHWILLALGLSQAPIWAVAIVFGWLLLLGQRERSPDAGTLMRFNLRQLLIVAATVVALVLLMGSIYDGLLGHPDMQISGNGSAGSNLRWFQDRTAGEIPRGWVLSVPMTVYRGAMLVWSLWLAFALLGWLRWAWKAFTTGGAWKSLPPRPKSPPKTPAPPTVPPASPPVPVAPPAAT